MNTSSQKAILAHVAAEYPREACGFLLDVNGRERYFPCTNLAKGTDHFIIGPKDYAAAEDTGSIIAIVHSHPDLPPLPSQSDRVMCEAHGVPWHIVSWPANQWHSFAPDGYEAPLIGREFYHGVLDCYALVRDWYKRERGIDLPDFLRTDGWWNEGQNLYLDNFEKVGFVRVLDAPPEPGDALLMHIMSPVPNHAAVFLGGDTILHHLHGRLSKRDIWGGMYKRNTTHILRYRGPINAA